MTWTPEETGRAAIWGLCPRCHQPRDVWTVTGARTEDRTVWVNKEYGCVNTACKPGTLVLTWPGQQ